MWTSSGRSCCPAAAVESPMNVRVLRADPAGNITLFVLDPVPSGERAALAARLMKLPEMGIEQIGFRCLPEKGGDGRLEMAGGEFCGNAARAFGMLIAREKGGADRVRIEISGCDRPVAVDVDLTAGTARSEMPLPREVRPAAVDGYSGVLVHLGGIAHLVVEGMPPSLDFFLRAEPVFQTIPGLEAYGVIFLEGEKLTPLVKVPAARTLVWEGSCGSGSLAAAVAQSRNVLEGRFVRDYRQPAGTVRAGVMRTAGRIEGAYIEGPVSLGDPVAVKL